MGNQNSVYFGAPPVRKQPRQHAEEHQEAWRQIAARVPKKEKGSGNKRKVAIVGSGVTGLGAAYHFLTSAPDDVDVVVYESSKVPGGHAHTEVAEGVGCDTVRRPRLSLSFLSTHPLSLSFL